ncbi:hypothetical protein SDRG_02691 [Saprolegnia diclina VS20]|uniref:SCD domain-containing protein n=1 Tax=Saprolegnia diclina (strain VS20) TaxID=1156394 RepID=T0QPK4_SAPDV|nr:hypothetical protein SDRG_02691 [Saprolegnia diclina VS20]EQC40034.1 hypothetical protein SDRG_02691 [Saprolegnia diclina VS20]|eukprot:XP_008606508.1 hypothetical protein SDRG_02691 [Saprolegnia diclina VS20]
MVRGTRAKAASAKEATTKPGGRGRKEAPKKGDDEAEHEAPVTRGSKRVRGKPLASDEDDAASSEAPDVRKQPVKRARKATEVQEPSQESDEDDVPPTETPVRATKKQATSSRKADESTDDESPEPAASSARGRSGKGATKSSTPSKMAATRRSSRNAAAMDVSQDDPSDSDKSATEHVEPAEEAKITPGRARATRRSKATTPAKSTTPNKATSEPSAIEEDANESDVSEYDEEEETKTSTQRRSARTRNPAPTYKSPSIAAMATAAAVESSSVRPHRAPRPNARTLNPKMKAVKGKGGRKKEESDDEVDKDLFEAVREGTCSIPDLLQGWRSRYESDTEAASRELLNFLLQSCGAASKSIKDDDDIEELDMGALVDAIVVDLEASKDLNYPIVSKTKVYRYFKSSFAEFWEQFVVECWDSETFQLTDVVENCIDWLTTLSSAEVRAVRHTSTVAAYEIGKALVDRARLVRDQMAPIARQYTAEAKKLKDTPKKTPKFKKLHETKTKYDTQRKKIMAAIDMLFKGVIVHRYRDIMPEVRAASVAALGAWIQRMPDVFLEDNYLKYLGWMLNDKHAKVRVAVLEALQGIYESAKPSKLEAFNARFLRRYLEMCDDVDDDVVLRAIHLVAKIDRLDMLGDDCDLTVVERLVFYDQDDRISKAAAEFACLQYDAFGVSRQKELSEAQLTTQAIALIEFADEYMESLGEIERPMETLVGAFWDLEDCQVIQNWRLLAKLLGSDSQDPALTSEQQTILIQLIAAVLKQLSEDESAPKARKASSRKKTSDEEPASIYFCRELPHFMMRFQADSEKVCLLLQWLSLLNWNASNINQHHEHVEMLLQRLKQVYITYSEEPFLDALSSAFHYMAESSNTTLKRDVDVVLFAIAQEGVDQCATLIRQRNLDDDEQFTLRAWLARLSFLGGYLDLREYLKATDRTLLLEFIADRSTHFAGDALAIKYALNIVLKDLLWATTPVFDMLEKSEVPDDVDTHIQKVLRRRHALEDALLQLLSMHLKQRVTRDTLNVHDVLDDELDEDAPHWAEIQAVQLEAFKALCDVRCLCVEKFVALAPPLDIVAYKPHPNLLALSQSFYERALESDDEDENAQRDVVVALASASIWNPQNKRQAASVLRLVTYAGLRPIAKAFGKLLSSLSPVKLLEVQMVALRHTFEDSPQTAIDLAKALSQSLGVKLPVSLRGSYLKFLFEGLRVSLLSPLDEHVGFLQLLKPYLYRLEKAAMKELQEHFDALRSRLVDDTTDVDGFLDEFYTVFTGAGPKSSESSSVPTPKKRRRATSLSDDDDDDTAATNPTVSNVTIRKRRRGPEAQPTRRSSRIRSAPDSDDEVFDLKETPNVKMSSEASADDENADEEEVEANENEEETKDDEEETKDDEEETKNDEEETKDDEDETKENDEETKDDEEETKDDEEETEANDVDENVAQVEEDAPTMVSDDDDEVASFRTKRRKTG